ncbi:oleate delta-12 desaturase [Xylogone sp. PMI_703]|nr:oleate delta-12 desaturase [Xylogone sp. PMI_703]
MIYCPISVDYKFESTRKGKNSPTPLHNREHPTITSEAELMDLYGNEFKVPDFTIKQIRDAIPRHCFKRSAAISLYYAARDFVSVGVVLLLFHTYASSRVIPSSGMRALLWTLYTVIQGLFATGIWVLGHECGHQAFSEYKLLNDTVGWICHSFVLVPYFSFKLSHRKHHKATGNISRDMGFVPKTRSEYASHIGKDTHAFHELVEELPIVTAASLITQQLIGWPMYLLTNVSGNNNHESHPEGRGKGKRNGLFGGVNHFNPASPLFESKDAKVILLSDLGLLIMLSFLGYIGLKFGWYNLFVWYGIPYIWLNHWIAAITYLQHTDASVPRYQPEAWNFIRGACATVDRDLGFVGRFFFHQGTDTHVLHHFVSTIPFYNAAEATEALRQVMGIHYRRDPSTGMFAFLRALWINYRTCQWMEPTEGAKGQNQAILFFRNHNGIGIPPAKI